MKNIFGDELEVLDHCPRCSAPMTRPVGTKGTVTLFHAKGCSGGRGDELHQSARAAMDESCARDFSQIQARERVYGGNVDRPLDFKGKGVA